MEPKIIELGEMILAGFDFFGNPFKSAGGWSEENEIGRLWKRFYRFMQEYGERMPQAVQPGVGYEVCIDYPESKALGEFEVFVGYEIKGVEHLPVEMVYKILPSARYAVFTLAGEEITSDWGRRASDWMEQNGCHPDGPYNFQRYDGRFKGMNRIMESEIDVYFPIQVG